MKKYIIIIGILIVVGVGLISLNIIKSNSNNTNSNDTNSNNNRITVNTNGGVPYSWEYNLSNEDIVTIKKSSKALNDETVGGLIEVYFDVIPKKEGKVFLTLNYKDIRNNTIEETKKYSIEVNQKLEVKITME